MTTLPSGVLDSVGAILRATAASVVMPHFVSLRPGDVTLKGKDDPVTIADRRAEEVISRELTRLLPGSRVVGEEACAGDPALLHGLGEGIVWVVDPIDGTANFIAGRSTFAMMVALLREGELVGAWILEPLSGRLVVAERGAGAWLDGAALRTCSKMPDRCDLTGIASEAFVPSEQCHVVDRIRTAVPKVVPTARCAGYEYPLVATGVRHFALYWRTLVWDHAPGALILIEAGGTVTHLDGTPYNPCQPKTGLLLAHNARVSDYLLGAVRQRH